MDIACHPGDAALARVLSLPRRSPASPELIEALSRAMRVRSTDVCPAGPGTPDAPCKRCGGTGRIMLRPAQVEALRELWEYRCLFGAMGVGSGKTLVSMLAATLLEAQRPVLTIPAQLESKTKREFVFYQQDWRVRLPTIVTYQKLGHPNHADLLFKLNPDLLIDDEATSLSNPSAAVTRRWRRYVQAVECVKAAMSGTLIGENLMDYHHIAVDVMGDRAPMPTRPVDAEKWAAALDRDLGILHRAEAGALATIPGGYHEWFRNSRGVVSSHASDCDASIRCSTWSPPIPKELSDVIDSVARSSLRPDDELLDEYELPECLSQLCLGFYLRWDPSPPDWWLHPRRDWWAYQRDVLEQHLEHFDSQAPIVTALDDPNRPQPPDADYGRVCLAAWRAVAKLFEPNSVPVWLSDEVMQQVASHARVPGTLVWVHNRAAGHRLHQLGLTYYGGNTEPENSAKPGTPISLSIKAHATGRNLQHGWHRSLVLNIPAKAPMHEQLIGRTHRAGQRKDPVEVEYIQTIDYHRTTLHKVRLQARAITTASGFPHKLTLADWETE